ncbi:MAG TPA: hypothetical protein VFA22_08820 [Stellaceae bacterium]|nr:hypothetical protein [Stellaceae bacterium]
MTLSPRAEGCIELAGAMAATYDMSIVFGQPALMAAYMFISIYLTVVAAWNLGG